MSDLENQAAGLPPASPLPITGGRNYEYDGSGNLVYDRSEGTLIKWNAQGKVEEVRKDLPWGISQTTKFWYNAAGNRVKKQVINHLATDPEESSVTYYVRDANEAVMAIYQQTVFHASGPPGCLRKPNNPSGAPDWENDGVVEIPWSCDNCRLGAVGLIGGEWNPWQEDYDQDGLGDACDPCPFIFGSVCDPQQPGLPAMPDQWNGVATTTKLAELPIYSSERLGLMRPNVLCDTVIVINPTPSIFTRRVDQKEYELKDHLGNVRVVVSDMKKRVGDLTATFTLRVKSVNAYYAFGMLEEGMSGSSEGYRYGFNGMEMDNELKGVGNSLDYGARMYDPRLGRFMSMDPFANKFSWLSPYTYSNNSPILFIDSDGEKPLVAIIMEKNKNEFNDHVAKLKKLGYEVVYVKNGSELIHSLDDLSTVEDPIQHLIILSHGSSAALFGSDITGDGHSDENGLYTEKGFIEGIGIKAVTPSVINQWKLDGDSRFIEGDDKGNSVRAEQFIGEKLNNSDPSMMKLVFSELLTPIDNGARTTSDLSQAVFNGSIVMSSTANVTIGGCETVYPVGIGVTNLASSNIAQQIGQALNSDVVGSSSKTSPRGANSLFRNGTWWFLDIQNNTTKSIGPIGDGTRQPLDISTNTVNEQ